jgi:hypothetical protein
MAPTRGHVTKDLLFMRLIVSSAAESRPAKRDEQPIRAHGSASRPRELPIASSRHRPRLKTG